MVCPANVSQTFPIEVCVRCADNFMVAGYKKMNMHGTYHSGTPPTESNVLPVSHFVGQAGTGTTPYTTLSYEDAELYCIGNAMRSLKQVLNVGVAATPTVVENWPVAPDDKFTTRTYDWVYDAQHASQQGTNNPHAIIHALYAFWRGSWSLTTIVDPGSLVEATTDQYTTITATDIITVTVPYRSKTTRSAFGELGQFVKVDTKKDIHVSATAHAGDDFQLGYTKYLPWLKI
jgi:hypothetical protein